MALKSLPVKKDLMWRCVQSAPALIIPRFYALTLIPVLDSN